MIINNNHDITLIYPIKRNPNYVRFAPVAPIDLLMKMNDIPDIVMDYHLLLAHDVVAKPSRYKEGFQAIRAKNSIYGRATCVIMDTSVIELGESVSHEKLLEAAEIVNAQIIVLPDIIGDHLGTLNHAFDFSQTFPQALDQYEFMLVPQGTTVEQYVRCIELSNNMRWVQWLGLPRDSEKYDVGRGLLAETTAVVARDKLIHLLGFSDCISDDIMVARECPNIVGIDSAVPIRIGQKNTELVLSHDDYEPRGTFWDDPHEVLEDQTLINYRRILSYLN